jgi:hypothetical protein
MVLECIRVKLLVVKKDIIKLWQTNTLITIQPTGFGNI